MRQIIFLICLSVLVRSKLWVYAPDTLRNQFKDQNHGEIKSSYANYGIVPYGSSMIGRYYYDENNADGCTTFSGNMDKLGDPDGIFTPMVIVKRGHCSFVKKTRNVQDWGGTLCLIIDDKPVEDPESLVMMDDGTGGNIHIPTILLGLDDGNKLINFISVDREGETAILEKKQASLVAEFLLPAPDNRVEYEIWTSSGNKDGMNFISNFMPYYQHLGNYTLFTPHYVMWTCPMCSGSGNDDCYCGGEYCAPPLRKEGKENAEKTDGKQILDEDLIQICIYNTTKDGGFTYFRYVSEYLKNCDNLADSDCSQKIQDKLKIDKETVKKCVDDSFVKGTEENKCNSGFEYELNSWINLQGAYYPSVTINNRTFRGNLDPEVVFHAICAGFRDTPEVCYREFHNSARSNSKAVNVEIVVAVVCALIFINILLLFCYRRCAQKEMKRMMDQNITSAVTQYMALSDKSQFGTGIPSTQD